MRESEPSVWNERISVMRVDNSNRLYGNLHLEQYIAFLEYDDKQCAWDSMKTSDIELKCTKYNNNKRYTHNGVSSSRFCT
jgi:hypothetical protein